MSNKNCYLQILINREFESFPTSKKGASIRMVKIHIHHPVLVEITLIIIIKKNRNNGIIIIQNADANGYGIVERCK